MVIITFQGSDKMFLRDDDVFQVCQYVVAEYFNLPVRGLQLTTQESTAPLCMLSCCDKSCPLVFGEVAHAWLISPECSYELLSSSASSSHKLSRKFSLSSPKSFVSTSQTSDVNRLQGLCDEPQRQMASTSTSSSTLSPALAATSFTSPSRTFAQSVPQV
jgi:hypothetical protein